MGEAPDLREQGDCPSPEACDQSCDQHEKDLSPNIDHLLRQVLVEALIADGVPAGDAEVVADETIALAKQRGADLRAKREVLPSGRDRE